MVWQRSGVYQRRTARPVAALVTVLLVGAVVTWSVVLSSATTGATSGCPPPRAPGAATLGDTLPSPALDQVAPAAPGAVRVRVLNAGGQRGQANLVASQLGEFGFPQAAEPTNDPLYPDGGLACRGNIRFGPNGAAAARTLSLALPCMALVRDTRPGETVDVVIGTTFSEVNPNKSARDALRQLGPTQAPSEPNGVPPAPTADPELLTTARDVEC